MESMRIEGGDKADLLAYINNELDVAGDEAYCEEVTSQLLERAGGNFLWLHLAVQRINTCHTRVDVENALKDLPVGMETLYDRMAASVQSRSSGDRELAQRMLSWTTCSQRPLRVEELSDALGSDAVLDIHRSIVDLCGGFLVVDQDGKVSMIHETAREYLTRRESRDRSLVIDRKAANDMIFRGCISRLTDPKLRSMMGRGLPPALLNYAVSSWFIHLSLGTATDESTLHVVVDFLRSPHLLMWVSVAARNNDLRSLVVASRYLTTVAAKLQQLEDQNRESLVYNQAKAILEGWATDLVKIVGRFGNSLRQHPDSIHKLIPPFCPEESVVYQQFGRKESRALSVSGFTSKTWDDCLARFSFDEGVAASGVSVAGGRIAVLTHVLRTSEILIYASATLEEEHRLIHPERVASIQVSKFGDLLVSYGFATTRVWDMETGECVKVINNPEDRPRPHAVQFTDHDRTVLVAGEDRRIRSFSLVDSEDSGDESSDPGWTVRSEVYEQPLEGTTLNFPKCSALSPDGNKIAFGYRGYPLTAWEISDSPMLIGRCIMRQESRSSTMSQEYIWGEVFRVIWHPFSGEVLGLTMVGVLFKWDPYEEQPSIMVQSGGKELSVSVDGSLIVTGDVMGTIKIYATNDFSLLYQLTSRDFIVRVVFSTDSRRLYDIRGAYGNVWEPNTLLRLADSSEYPDHNSDAISETESLAKFSLHAEHHFASVDKVTCLSGQSAGPLYCYGTAFGIARIGEVGRGKVCDVDRPKRRSAAVDQVAWSDDGRLMATTDTTRKLYANKISKSGENRDVWEATCEFDVAVPPNGEPITQLIFHPTGHELLVSTSSTLFSITTDKKPPTVEAITLPTSMGKVKWVTHPTSANYLLGLGNTKVHVLRWEDLRLTQDQADLVHDTYTYFPPRLDRPATISAPTAGYMYNRGGSFHNRDGGEVLGRIIVNIDSAEILLEISRTKNSGRVENAYLLFCAKDIGGVGSSEDPGNSDGIGKGKQLTYSTLPKEVASRIREPLAFLSRRRLVFLDVDGWVCTWNPNPNPTRPRQLQTGQRQQGPNGPSSSGGVAGVEQHYFLPGDWATADEAHVCSVMSDGTLLCPRNGDVAAVQAAALLRK